MPARNKSTVCVQGYRLIAGYLGMITMLIGTVILLPLLVLPFYPKDIIYAKYFIITAVPTILIGYLFTLLIRGRQKGRLHKNQDAIIVLGSWILAVCISTLPFILTGKYNFTQSAFETTSAYTTTGLTVVDPDTTANIFLMYRSIMLFVGGVGLVLVMMSVLSDAYGMRLYAAEGHSDRLMPNLAKSARVIIAIYAGYILGGTVAYVAFGMSVFDAINHSIAAVSTGGFSTRTANIGYYNSVPIELVSVVLMMLGCTNFLMHLMLIKGHVRDFFHHCEVKLMLFCVAVATPLMAVLMLGGMAKSLPSALRIALFQGVSALTTTGFQTVPSFAAWPSSLLLIMTVLHIIGGGAGSTAGGMKQFRVYVILKEAWWQIRARFSHKRILRVNQIERFGKKEVVDSTFKSEVYAFAVLYMLLFVLGSFIFTLFGYPLDKAMFEFSSALSTVGLSAGITGYSAHPVLLWTATLGMFVGRLEIYIIFLALIRIGGDAKGSCANAARKAKALLRRKKTAAVSKGTNANENFI